MNKDEILAKSRSEDQTGDERSKLIRLQASNFSRAFGIALCFLFSIVDEMIFKTGVLAGVCCWIYLASMVAEGWFYSIKMKNRKIMIGCVGFTVFLAVGLWAIIYNYSVEML